LTATANDGDSLGPPRGCHHYYIEGGPQGADVQTYSAFYQHELSKLILEEVERRKEQLVTASATFDFSDYRHHVGIIEGLRTAIELCEEAERVVNGGDRNR